MNTHAINEAQFNEDPPSPIQYVLAAIIAIAAMTVQGRVIASGAASVVCAAAISLVSTLRQYGQAAISAVASVSAIGSRTLQGSASCTPSEVMSADSHQIHSGAATVTATAAVTVIISGPFVSAPDSRVMRVPEESRTMTAS